MARIVFLVALIGCNVSWARVVYPTRGWPTGSLEAAGFDTHQFDQFRNYVFDPQAQYKTDALVVIKGGRLVYEEYANGYGPEQPHMLWSFSKSMANAILGVAEQKGIVNRGTLVSQFYPELRRAGAEFITLEDLMRMTSGLNYYEENPASILFSDSIFINYSIEGYRDMAQWMARKTSLAFPGVQFNYSSGDCALAMGVLRRAIADQRRYDEFPWRELFYKLGMRSVVFEQDLGGTFVGGSFGWSSARDIAKLAYLYMNNGVWEGQRLFPEDWVRWSFQTTPALMRRELRQSSEMRLNREDYGAWWWLNKKLPMNEERPYPNAPEDMFMAMGYRGQTMAAIPSLGLIVVRLGSDGLDEERKIDRHHMLDLLLESMNRLDSSRPPPKHKEDSIFVFSGLLDMFEIIRALLFTNTSLDDGVAMAPAKDLCSCIYVSGQSENHCLQTHEQYRLFRRLGIFDGWIGEAQVDHSQKSVSIESDLHLATARWVSPTLGCRLTRFRAKLRPPPNELIPQVQ